MKDICFIDSFSVGLDDLPVRKQRNTRVVLQAVVSAGRYSVFEATANDVIATTMDRIVAHGLVDTDISSGFPWTKVAITPAGKRYLDGTSLRVCGGVDTPTR